MTDRLREIKEADAKEEAEVLNRWPACQGGGLEEEPGDAEAALDAEGPPTTPTERSPPSARRNDDKWLAALSTAIHGEMHRISQALTQRVKELADRYRHTCAADGPPRDGIGGQGKPASSEDGVRMELKAYKQSEAGVIPAD